MEATDSVVNGRIRLHFNCPDSFPDNDIEKYEKMEKVYQAMGEPLPFCRPVPYYWKCGRCEKPVYINNEAFVQCETNVNQRGCLYSFIGKITFYCGQRNTAHYGEGAQITQQTMSKALNWASDMLLSQRNQSDFKAKHDFIKALMDVINDPNKSHLFDHQGK